MTEQGTADAAWDDELPEETRRRRAMTPAQWQSEARALEVKLSSADADRVDVLIDAAHAWEQAGDFDAAERCHQQLLAEPPDPDMPDPRVPYGLFLLERRDSERGHALLQQLWDERDTDPTTYVLVAESHEQRGAHGEALTWCNAGLSRCYPEPFDPVPEDVQEDWSLTQLLAIRARIRQTLQQPADQFDELIETARQRIADGIESAPLTEDRAPLVAPVVPYWPQDEFEAALRQWPETIVPDGATGTTTHVAHRLAVERDLRTAANGETPHVVTVREVGFRAFRAERGAGNVVTALQQHAAELAGTGGATTWPPGRNDTCWCGSGRKYKKCCGGPGVTGTTGPPANT